MSSLAHSVRICKRVPHCQLLTCACLLLLHPPIDYATCTAV
jgi:hypothetical protein